MEEVDYAELLEVLKKDKDGTLLKLHAIDAAIEAINSLNTNVYTLKSGEFKVKKGLYDDFEINPPTLYKTGLTVMDMFLYALYVKRNFSAHDAAKYIHEIDPSNRLEFLMKRFTDIGSGLGKANKLNIKKEGKKYIYSLKHEDWDRAYRLGNDLLPF